MSTPSPTVSYESSGRRLQTRSERWSCIDASQASPSTTVPPPLREPFALPEIVRRAVPVELEPGHPGRVQSTGGTRVRCQPRSLRDSLYGVDAGRVPASGHRTGGLRTARRPARRLRRLALALFRVGSSASFRLLSHGVGRQRDLHFDAAFGHVRGLDRTIVEHHGAMSDREPKAEASGSSASLERLEE